MEEVLSKKLLTFLTDEQQNLSNQRLRQLYSREIDKLPFQEFKVRKIDGSFIDVESTAIIASYNDVEAILVVAKDITEDKKMKLKLKEAEEKYRSISEESLVGVYMFEDGRVTYVNKEV
ncbi:PAS domain S-box protein [Neobacillus niacini]|uniref:PAS domain S-box protein n=1 Tax=Neobacillus niacini TaxID=86668 RepID=UPI003B025FFF